MKKFVTLMLVALVAVSALFVLVACEDPTPLADETNQYVIVGEWAGWKVNTDENDESKLDSKFAMTAIALSDSRVKSIKDQLTDAKYLYIAEHEFVNEGSKNTISYALTEGAEPTVLNENMCIKIIRTRYETAGASSAWLQEWLPDAGNTTFRSSLTPATLYCPPHSEKETYPGSGAWNNNPVALQAGTYYVVFATFTDGTYGLGLIAK